MEEFEANLGQSTAVRLITCLCRLHPPLDSIPANMKGSHNGTGHRSSTTYGEGRDREDPHREYPILQRLRGRARQYRKEVDDT